MISNFAPLVGGSGWFSRRLLQRLLSLYYSCLSMLIGHLFIPLSKAISIIKHKLSSFTSLMEDEWVCFGWLLHVVMKTVHSPNYCSMVKALIEAIEGR